VKRAIGSDVIALAGSREVMSRNFTLAVKVGSSQAAFGLPFGF
jgi:hypothetical protein